MSANDNALIVPGHGAVFQARSSATLPADPLSAFVIGQDAPEGWTDLGHTSKENTIAFAKDGGENSQLDSWYMDAVRVVYGSTTWTATINALQMDKNTLDLAFNGELDAVAGRYVVPATAAASTGQTVILFQDTSGSMLFHLPNTQTTLGEAPSVSVEGFFEVQLSLSILSSSKLSANGRPGLMAIYGEWLKTTTP